MSSAAVRELWMQMIKDCAKKYKDKLSPEEIQDILSTGNATGDGRLGDEEIEEAIKLGFKE